MDLLRKPVFTACMSSGPSQAQTKGKTAGAVWKLDVFQDFH